MTTKLKPRDGRRERPGSSPEEACCSSASLVVENVSSSERKENVDSSQSTSGSGDSQKTQPFPGSSQEVGGTEPVWKEEAKSLREAWGSLEAINTQFVTIRLTESMFDFGRNDERVERALADSKFFNHVSRKHFKIVRREDETFLKDTSLLGTYVNGEKMVKGREWPLVNNDVISLCESNLKVFQFIAHEKRDVDLILPDEFKAKYIVGREIGSGVSCTVYSGYLKRGTDFSKVAIKVIKKVSWEDEQEYVYRKEVDILKRLDHPNVIKYYDSFEIDEAFVIILEQAVGGELFDYVEKANRNGNLDEKVAKFQMYQLLKGLAYLHGKGVAHRDFKLENILFATKNDGGLLKISDFGLSKRVCYKSALRSYVGTITYMAPEVVLNEASYTNKADCWSLGCVLYSLLSGCAAFSFGTSEEVLKKSILRGHFNLMTGSKWKAVSEQAKQLVRQLLTVDVGKRLSAEEALRHPWFQTDPDLIAAAENVIQGRSPFVELKPRKRLAENAENCNKRKVRDV